jgi:hypothetical protein
VGEGTCPGVRRKSGRSARTILGAQQRAHQQIRTLRANMLSQCGPMFRAQRHSAAVAAAAQRWRKVRIAELRRSWQVDERADVRRVDSVEVDALRPALSYPAGHVSSTPRFTELAASTPRAGQTADGFWRHRRFGDPRHVMPIQETVKQ